MKDKKDREICERIAQTLNDIAEGDIYIVRGELRHWDTLTQEERDLIVGDGAFEEATMADYFGNDSDEGYLDVNYVIDRHRNYRSCRVLIQYGGPNIWVDTDSGRVELYRLGSYAEAGLSQKACTAVDDYFEQQWLAG